PDTGDPVTDGFCNLPLHYQVRMDIDTQLAGVVYSAVDDVEVAAED
ncbi:MAG: hypothetical protein GY788_29040, partial [bacterium]|nr:hypothetical protein [bacterium]